MKLILIGGLILALLFGVGGATFGHSVADVPTETTRNVNFGLGFNLSDERPIQEAQADSIQQENDARKQVLDAQADADSTVIQNTLEDRTQTEQTRLDAERKQIAADLAAAQSRANFRKEFWKWFLWLLAPSMMLSAIVIIGNYSAKLGIQRAAEVFRARVYIHPGGEIEYQPALIDQMRNPRSRKAKVMIPGLPVFVGPDDRKLLPDFFVNAAAKIEMVRALASTMDEQTRADTSVSAYAQLQKLLSTSAKK